MLRSAAFGALFAGQLVLSFAAGKDSASMASAYAQMGVMITFVYVIGMILIWFAPETKGKPLPQ